MRYQEVLQGHEASAKESREEGFAKFMEKPETKLMISLIPPSETQEAVRTLAQAAFNYGHEVGQGILAISFIKAMFAKDNNDE